MLSSVSGLKLHQLFLVKLKSSRLTSHTIFSRGAGICRHQIIGDLFECRLTGTSFDDVGGNRVRFENALGRKENPASVRFIMHQTHAPTQAGPSIRRNGIAAHGLSCGFGMKAPYGT